MKINILTFISLTILFSYISLMLFYWYHWSKSDINKNDSLPINLHKISIIIIGRNEAANIERCIKSIANNNYPKSLYEIIYIDDFSKDKSIEILKSLKISNLRVYKLNSFIGNTKINNFKKVAIKQAISISTGDIILQTDADTFVGKYWISSHNEKYTDLKTNFVTAPVLYLSQNKPLEQFQKYDLITTMGVTASGIASGLHFMANGANMSFRKDIYQNLNNQSKYASGDDMFLVQSIAAKYPNSVKFLKNSDAIIKTYPETHIKDFFKQRLRWATKTKSYKNHNLQLMILLVFFTGFVIISNIFLIPFIGLKQLNFTILIVFLKLIIDYIFITSIAKFLNEKINPFSIIYSLLLYPFYIVSIGIISAFTIKYNWKGRKVS